MPGLASALQSAVARERPTIMQAADRLITSPEFVAAVNATGTRAAPAARQRLARSPVFTRFVRAAGQPREMGNRELWILQAMQAAQVRGQQEQAGGR